MIKLWLHQQLGNHGGLFLMTDGTIRQPDKQGIGRINIGTSQPQKKPKPPWHTIQEPATANIRVQADGNLRHGDTAFLGNDPMRAARHQAKPPAHNYTVPPADHRFTKSVQ